MKVSVIMPTANRPNFLNRAIEGYLKQDYEGRELVIVGSGWEDYPSYYSDYTHFHMCDGSLGMKRNTGIFSSRGEIILHMDDDDYYAPDWISKSVAHLLETGADMTGINKAYFYSGEQMWEYEYKGDQPYVIGASMCYHRKVWERTKFKDVNTAEDTLFCGNAGKIVPHDYQNGFIAMIHGANTASHKQLHRMKPINPEIAKEILDADYKKYS